MPELEVRTIHQTEDHCIAAWKDVCIVIWRRDTTFDGVRRLVGACVERTRSYPDGLQLLSVVESGATAPSAEVRAALANGFREIGDRVRYSALIMEGDGLRAAMVRSIVIGITMLAKFPFPHRVHSLGDAIIQFERAHGGPGAYKELPEVLEILRANPGSVGLRQVG